MGMPHVEVAGISVDDRLPRRQRAKTAQIGAAAVVRAERQVLQVGKHDRDRLAVIRRIFVRRQRVVRTGMAVDVPAKVLAGPFEDRVVGFARHGPQGEVRPARSGPAPGALSSIRPSRAIILKLLPCVMKRMQVAPGIDHPHQQFFAGMHPRQAVVWLGRQPGHVCVGSMVSGALRPLMNHSTG